MAQKREVIAIAFSRGRMTLTFENVGGEDAGAESQEDYPAKWEICGTCHGHSRHTRAVEGKTVDLSMYLSGKYDERCADCHNGKVMVADMAALPKSAQRQVETFLRASAHEAAESAHVRRSARSTTN